MYFLRFKICLEDQKKDTAFTGSIELEIFRGLILLIIG